MINFGTIEIASIRYWLFEENKKSTNNEIRKEVELFEKGFISKYNPKFNLSEKDIQVIKQIPNFQVPNINELRYLKLTIPDIKRDDPLERIKVKSRHTDELALKSQLTGLSNKDKKALKVHSKDLFNISKDIND